MGKSKNKGFVDKLKDNRWIVSTFVFGILAIVLIIITALGSMNSSSAGHKFVDFINSQEGSQIEFVSAESFGPNLYEVTVLADGQEVSVHITQDGKYFVQLVAPIEEEMEEVVEGIVKADKPLIQLFVMTHCPYGTQAEKGFVSIARLLENVADVEIRFVHYFLHDPEYDETPKQVCIREEQSDKFLDYLECFLEDGDSDRCVLEVGIDEASMNECISSGRSDDYYAEDSALSEAAGVQGSPSLVVNGGMVSSGRSSSAYLDVVCQSFNDVPELCAEEVDSTNPSPGFGYSPSSSGSTASCG